MALISVPIVVGQLFPDYYKLPLRLFKAWYPPFFSFFFSFLLIYFVGEEERGRGRGRGEEGGAVEEELYRQRYVSYLSFSFFLSFFFLLLLPPLLLLLLLLLSSFSFFVVGFLCEPILFWCSFGLPPLW